MIEKNYKNITAILTVKNGKQLLQDLSKEKGIIMADYHFARGDSLLSHHFASETEVFNIIVEEERAEEIFDYLYHKLEIYKEGVGILYQNGLRTSTEYTLPNDLGSAS